MKSLYLVLVVTSLVSACTPTGLRSPGPSNEYAWTNRDGATPEQVRPELLQCGNGRDFSNFIQLDGESLDNARARLQECLFAKGFFPKSGDGGYCSDRDYREKLPACANAPIRSRNNYYGQTPSEHEQRKLDQDMADAIKKYKAEKARSVELSFGKESVRFLNSEKLSNERTMQDSSDCNSYQKAVKSSGNELLQKEKYQAVECMLAKGYPFEDEKGLCKLPVWRDQISVCAPYAAAYAKDQKRVYDTFKTESWPYVRFTFENPQKYAMRRVRSDTDQCWSVATSDFRTDWTARRIQAIECMQAKGYQLVLEQPSFSCRNVDYRRSSICMGQGKSSD